MRAGLLLVLLLSAATGVSTQTAVANANWQGWMQCQVTVQGAGYTNRQTHTWRIAGPPTFAGAIEEYPAMWTVAGTGAFRGTSRGETVAAQWTTAGSAPNARIGVFVRTSDKRLVALVRNAPLRIPFGTTGAEQISPTGTTQPQTRPVSLPVSEWRPLPVIEDAAASTHLAGSSPVAFEGRLDTMQPIGAAGQVICSWDFARSPSVAAPIPSIDQPVAPTANSASTATTATGSTVISPAPRKATIASVDTTSQTTSSTLSATASPSGSGITAMLAGPGKVMVGRKGQFNLTVTLNAGTNVTTVNGTTTSATSSIQGANITFDSNEGETVATSLPANSTAPLSVTFTFEKEGTYKVSAGGVITKTTRYVTAAPRYQNESMFDSSCSCTRTVTTTTGYDNVEHTEIQSYPVSLQVTVTVVP